jgi:hypothetical protein
MPNNTTGFAVCHAGPGRVRVVVTCEDARSLAGQPISFLGVNTKDLEGAAKSFVIANDVTYPVIADEAGRTIVALGDIPGDLPFTVVIDRDQRVAAVYEERSRRKT